MDLSVTRHRSRIKRYIMGGDSKHATPTMGHAIPRMSNENVHVLTSPIHTVGELHVGLSTFRGAK